LETANLPRNTRKTNSHPATTGCIWTPELEGLASRQTQTAMHTPSPPGRAGLLLEHPEWWRSFRAVVRGPTYNVVINNIPVAVAGGTPAPGQPAFSNTLSAGDRNTLALAFFFASLEQDPTRGSKVVVIDDPISSLDEHRTLTTVQELRRLAQQTSQVILLSHSKPFLCRVWEGADHHSRAALELVRDGDGSTIRAWEVDRDT